MSVRDSHIVTERQTAADSQKVVVLTSVQTVGEEAVESVISGRRSSVESDNRVCDSSHEPMVKLFIVKASSWSQDATGT